jgi:hypothetical protein
MAWWQGVFFDGSMRFGTGLSYDGALPGGALYLGARLYETPSTYVWLDGGLNLPGADVSLSMGLALTDEIWLYTAPGLTVWVFPGGEQAPEVTVAYRLPIGLAYWSPGGDVSLRLEAGLLNQGVLDESQFFAGVGIVMPIGVKSSKD